MTVSSGAARTVSAGDQHAVLDVEHAGHGQDGRHAGQVQLPVNRSHRVTGQGRRQVTNTHQPQTPALRCQQHMVSGHWPVVIRHRTDGQRDASLARYHSLKKRSTSALASQDGRAV